MFICQSTHLPTVAYQLQALAVPQFITVIVATVDAGFGSSYSLLSSSDTAIVARVRLHLYNSPGIHTDRENQ
jgi:hypothetical protein